eukprot:scaffold9322_cov168-Amphora_coffeaeformis.AAC.6
MSPRLPSASPRQGKSHEVVNIAGTQVSNASIVVASSSSDCETKLFCLRNKKREGGSSLHLHRLIAEVDKYLDLRGLGRVESVVFQSVLTEIILTCDYNNETALEHGPSKPKTWGVTKTEVDAGERNKSLL